MNGPLNKKPRPLADFFPPNLLQGQRALVTGANSGIGACVAESLAASGAKVVINYIYDTEKAEALVGKIQKAGGEAMALKADVGIEKQVQNMFQKIIGTWGSIDILVNNAGIQKDAPLIKMSLQEWEHVLRTNLTGQFLCSREAVREYLRRGIDLSLSRSCGKIICISSVHDIIPWAGHANYAASKGGVTMLMKTLAQELAVHKIRVNGISPGAIKTPINIDAWSTPEKEANLIQLIPYGRVGEVEDIARAAVWLASDQSDYMTGTTLYIDGGMTLYPGFERGG